MTVQASSENGTGRIFIVRKQITSYQKYEDWNNIGVEDDEI